MRPSCSSRRRGFTLLDLAVVLAALGTLAALAAAGVSGFRSGANLAGCTARLGMLGAGSAQFALANKDLMAGLTWQTGGANSKYPDLNVLQSTPGVGAHAAQAVDILRRRGRPDIPPINGWMPDLNYWSLALVDFENRSLADPFNVCPSHDTLNKWRRHPLAFDQGLFLPRQPQPSPTSKRWPYSSSYTLTGAAMDVNQTVFTPQAVPARVTNGATHNNYFIPPSPVLGPSPMSLVASPALKVHVFDSHQRHFPGPDLYFAYAGARQPLLFFDGSVVVRLSQDSMTPWIPVQPTSPLPESYLYQPSSWEAPTQSGQAAETVVDRYRWTRDGLLGRDF